MRNYSYQDKWEKLLTPGIVNYLALIHEYKGKQVVISDLHEDVLQNLVEIARIQSTEGSNKIEGIFTSDERLKKIVLDKTTPHSRDECEIAGYRDVLNTIHDSYAYIPLRPAYILQLHRDMYRYEGTRFGGTWKSSDNSIEEISTDGTRKVRFKPVAAWETPEAMEQLCSAYQKTIQEGIADPLLLIPMFILDFLCIHPFLDGNGRMSRLLTLLLMYQNGYDIGKYISIEKLIETRKEQYYDALQASSAGWYEEQNNYQPFAAYMLGIITAAYREFFERTEFVKESRMAKPDRLEDAMRRKTGTFTKTEIQNEFPDIGQATIQRTLINLQKDHKIIKIGDGRYTKYRWNRE
ncbi:MAG: Fic family protein [Lactimicrobium massiliense]|nr:Fic family protein [Lactimicrobium massiliense]MDD6229493.1 Fic family protein [Lactimicrobium massiliense]MDD6560367.1 Fic family protein [Lactimicrobium massiliense]